MSVLLRDLVLYANALLRIDDFSDYCPNGLQVDGNPRVSRIVTGVTANESLIDEAIRLQADTIIVHHGFFWKGENPILTGAKFRRIHKLLSHNISLLAYHLPLDTHPQLGNNAQLAEVLGFKVLRGLDDSALPIGLVGELPEAKSVNSLKQSIGAKLQRSVLHVGPEDRVVKRVAWCTGAAQGYIQKAIDLQVDCYISGEISEQTVHVARDEGIVYFSCGHHATERYGVKALGMHLAQQFGVMSTFVDIDSPA